MFGRNFNGKIKGYLSCAISQKKYKFDMNPSQSKKTNIDVEAELKRLYFQMKNKIKSNKS